MIRVSSHSNAQSNKMIKKQWTGTGATNNISCSQDQNGK